MGRGFIIMVMGGCIGGSGRRGKGRGLEYRK